MPPGEARRSPTGKLQNEAVEMVGQENRGLASSFYPPPPGLLLTWTALLAAWWALVGRPGPSRPTAASAFPLPRPLLPRTLYWCSWSLPPAFRPIPPAAPSLVLMRSLWEGTPLPRPRCGQHPLVSVFCSYTPGSVLLSLSASVC